MSPIEYLEPIFGIFPRLLTLLLTVSVVSGEVLVSGQCPGSKSLSRRGGGGESAFLSAKLRLGAECVLRV